MFKNTFKTPKTQFRLLAFILLCNLVNKPHIQNTGLSVTFILIADNSCYKINRLQLLSFSLTLRFIPS